MVERPLQKQENESEEDKLVAAREEVSDRLDEIDEERAAELRDFTQTSTSTEITEYLNEHSELSPQEKFFLNVTLAIRKIDPKKDEVARSLKGHWHPYRKKDDRSK